MASIATDLVKIAIKKGSTWGTAVSVATTGYYTYGRMTVSGGYDKIVSDDIGFAGKILQLTYGKQNINVSFTFDLAFNQPLSALVGGVLGTEGNATETTGGQGDYSHAIDLADSNVGMFWTIAALCEDDRLIEIPSFKPVSFSVSGSINGKPTVTVQGVADRFVHFGDSPVNSVANITGLTARAYQNAVLGNTNHYFRINSDSGAGLSSTDDKLLVDYSLSVSRVLDPLFALRGANSKYTLEPTPLGDITGLLSFKLATNDDSAMDFLAMWRSQTTWKAELYMDGAQIAAGVNRSFKFQMPYLTSDGSLPSGFDTPAKNQRMQGMMQLQMMKRSAAPTGMTGITDYIRYTPIDLLNAKWTV